MSINVAHAVQSGNMAAEVANAIEAINLPEVQEIIKELAKYNLAVCVPHMHKSEQSFSVLPAGIVQVENNCHVTWVEKDHLSTDEGAIPVAWRWESDEQGMAGVGSVAACNHCLGPPCNPISPRNNVFSPMSCYENLMSK